MQVFIFLLIMAGIMFISIDYMKRYVMIKQRVEKLTSRYVTTIKDDFNRQDSFKKNYIYLAKRILNYLNVLTTDTTKTFSKRLANAGFLSKNALVVFLSAQMISIFSSIFIGFTLILFVPRISTKPLIIRAIVLVFVMWLGYRLPEFYLNRKTKSYHVTLRRSIIEFLDLFLICIEAGFSNDKALDRISVELAKLHPELSEQVQILITELHILPHRANAWDNFAERMGIEEAKVIVQIIKQSEQLGTSIAQALRAQLEMFRAERLSYVEHKAMRLPTVLTIPLVLFIFPALLLVILGPAIIKAMGVFSGS